MVGVSRWAQGRVGLLYNNWMVTICFIVTRMGEGESQLLPRGFHIWSGAVQLNILPCVGHLVYRGSLRVTTECLLWCVHVYPNTS